MRKSGWRFGCLPDNDHTTERKTLRSETQSQYVYGNYHPLAQINHCCFLGPSHFRRKNPETRRDEIRAWSLSEKMLAICTKFKIIFKNARRVFQGDSSLPSKRILTFLVRFFEMWFRSFTINVWRQLMKN